MVWRVWVGYLLLGVVQCHEHSARASSPKLPWGSPDLGSFSPAQLAKEKNSPPGSLTLVNESGTETVLSSGDFAKLPRQTIKAKDHTGVLAIYQGVSLAEVLRATKLALGKELKGPRLANYLLIEASDGYQVVFSLAEIDPSNTDHVVLVADRKDDKPLAAKEAPYRLIVPHDKKHARWVRQMTRISVRSAAEVGARAKNK
jgi:hypothetical protein